MGKRFHKGISPVIAVLLLIIIAVAAGLLIYIWISGYISGQTSGLTTQPPKIAGASARWAGSTLIIDVLVHNPAPTDTSVILKACQSAITSIDDCSQPIGSETSADLRAGELKRVVISGSPSGTIESVTVFLGTDTNGSNSIDSDEEVVDSIIISVPPS